jgi:hypothetical protein
MENEMRKDLDRVKNFVSLAENNDVVKDISYNLEVAKPNFLYFIKNINKELSQWIQYSGVGLDGTKIFFKFKSSQNSLKFEVFGGLDANGAYENLSGKSNEIYDYFKKVKYENI